MRKVVIFLFVALTWSSVCWKIAEGKGGGGDKGSMMDGPTIVDDEKSKYNIFKLFGKQFSQNFSAPWLSSNVDEIKFYIYGRPKNKNVRKELAVDDMDSFTDSVYDPDKRLLLIIHGFEASIESKATQDLKNTMLDSKEIFDDYNIVVVSWGKLAKAQKPEFRFFTFPIASANAELVAKRCIEFVKAAMAAKVLKKLDKIHIIGYDIGAQIGGYVAKTLFEDPSNKDHGKVARLTGLDPAGALYTVTGNPDLAITKKCAKFVDVYHTDVGRLGLAMAAGHVDFYPNGGGPYQPGCDEIDFDAAEPMENKKPLSRMNENENSENSVPAIFSGQCAHLKAVEFFQTSVTDKTYKGCDCPLITDEKCMKECAKSSVFGTSFQPIPGEDTLS